MEWWTRGSGKTGIRAGSVTWDVMNFSSGLERVFMMMEVEAQWFADNRIAAMYPQWKPNDMRRKAMLERLRKYPVALAEQALLESYAPGKKTLPEKDFFERLTALSAAQRKRPEPPTAVEVITDEQFRALMIDQAERGNLAAIDYCEKKQIEISIPF
jgi:hypothetical protein